MRRMVLLREQVREGTLLVVNRQHPLRSSQKIELINVGNGVQMERHAAAAFNECVRLVGGRETIVPVSGWRSAQEQKKIWDDTMRKEGARFTESYVAHPGCSEHQTGLAIDLGKAAESIDFIRPDFPQEGVCRAFRTQSVRWGFVQRYRSHKRQQTGIAEEPWHFRYVGAPHAQILESRDLCLEEYSDFLKQGPVNLELGGVQATVFYVPESGAKTVADVPDGLVQVSGDNCGGFILTVWRWRA